MKRAFNKWLFNRFEKLVYKLEVKYSKVNNTYQANKCHNLRATMQYLKRELIEV